MDRHHEFLADRLLSDGQPITYRYLSRALKVHVNTAKRMLYDFYKRQNETRANSVHATYLIYGIKSAKPSRGDENGDQMDFDNPNVNSQKLSPLQTLALVEEKNLNDVLRQYELVTSIHVYSLSPHPESLVTLLADISEPVLPTTEFDPSIAAAGLQPVQNLHVRKRRRPGSLPAEAPTPTNVNGPHSASASPKQTLKSHNSSERPIKDKRSSATYSFFKNAASTESPDKVSATDPPSDRAAQETTEQTTAGKAEEEDCSTALSDDGNADDSDPLPHKELLSKSGPGRVAMKEREEAIRRMMDVEDDKGPEAKDVITDIDTQSPPAPVERHADENELCGPEKTEVIASSGNGRRRGRRRVTKKKRILDEQGYLVTIHEADWESFSEEESAPPTAKRSSVGPASSSSKPKTQKASTKTAQGSIMSFFNKK